MNKNITIYDDKEKLNSIDLNSPCNNTTNEIVPENSNENHFNKSKKLTIYNDDDIFIEDVK